MPGSGLQSHPAPYLSWTGRDFVLSDCLELNVSAVGFTDSVGGHPAERGIKSLANSKRFLNKRTATEGLLETNRILNPRFSWQRSWKDGGLRVETAEAAPSEMLG